MKTFDIINWAVEEIKTAVKNGCTIESAKSGIELMVYVENLSNYQHDNNQRYNIESVWNEAKKRFLNFLSTNDINKSY